MIEIQEENNLEKSKPNNFINNEIELKDNLLYKKKNKDKINEKNKDLEKDKKLTILSKVNIENNYFNDLEEDDIYGSTKNSIELKKINSTKSITNKNKNKKKEEKMKKDKTNGLSTALLEENSKSDINNVTIQNFGNSDFNRESLQNLVNEKNQNIENKKIVQQNIKTKMRIFLLVIEIILGIVLIIFSFLILFIFFKDEILDKKIISIIIEPIIIGISVAGAIPHKGENYKKIVIILYLWEGLFLFPFSFYAKTGIIDEDLYDVCNKVLIVRLSLLAVQLLNFILSLILKIDI
jgi:hypothetical protein